MKKILLPFLVMATLLAHKSAHSATLQYYYAYEFLSASQVNYLAVGVRAKFKYASFEISNGIKKANRTARNANKLSNGTLLAMHIYPFHNTDKTARLVLTATHLSDIFKGKPFNDREEPVDHFFGAGYTIQKGNYEADIIFGRESHDCSLDSKCKYTNQIKAAVRYYF